MGGKWLVSQFFNEFLMQTEEVRFPIHDENCQHGLTIVEILADFYSFVGLAWG